MLRTIAALAILLSGPSALAADVVSRMVDITLSRQRLAEMERLCAADPKSGDCMIAAVSVQSDLARAVTAISYADDRDRMRPLVRRVLDLAPPGLQTTAAYAMARLIPDPVDTPRLVALLNDPVPTVRRAAWGALKASPDPAAREWVARAQFQAKGVRYLDDQRPLDSAALQVAVPPGTAQVWFEMECWRLGVQVFTAEGDPGAVITHFSAIAGQASRPLAEATDWFEGEKARKAYDRYANAAWFQTPYVIPLAFDAATGKPARLAIVWHDLLFNRTGYALQWLPAEAMPQFGTYPWQGMREMAVKLPEGAGTPPEPAIPFDKPGADKLDTDSYMAVVLGDGTGADTYLAMFPNGAYRAEVEAIKAQPHLAAAQAELVEPTSVTIRFSNLPTGEPVRFDVMSHDYLFEEAQRDSAPQPRNPVFAPDGAANGEVIWTSDQPLKPGLYEIRAFFGQPEMEFDAWSMRKALPAEQAKLFHTIRILPRLVKVATDKGSYAPNETVQIIYSDMPLAGSSGAFSPFFTIVKAGAPPKEWQQYVYTRDQAAGTVTLYAPGAPGAYEVRALFSEDGYVRGIADITVIDAAASPAAAPVDEPAPTAAPGPQPAPPPNDTDIQIALGKPSFAPNEPIIVTVSGLPGNAKDWIAVVPKAEADGVVGQWVYSGGAKDGTFTLPGQPAGTYEIRVRYNDEYTPVRARLAFEVK